MAKDKWQNSLSHHATRTITVTKCPSVTLTDLKRSSSQDGGKHEHTHSQHAAFSVITPPHVRRQKGSLYKSAGWKQCEPAAALRFVAPTMKKTPSLTARGSLAELKNKHQLCDISMTTEGQTPLFPPEDTGNQRRRRVYYRLSSDWISQELCPDSSEIQLKSTVDLCLEP